MKMGSLFDGSGGFPLAGSLCGFRPVWASEVEPYPIAVTRSRFPNMKHLGSVTDINGAEVEPVDIITFGSPCQDLSVAGKRAGLKHEDNGDDETTRSGLFMEAVRIIKEMREATNGRYPTFALWENVPGAFSSNKGEDFRVVLEEIIKIVEPRAVMPEVPKNGWPYADSYCGDGWSLSYRVLDAQYIRTAQRRRRVFLVLNLRGERARKILFERDRLYGNPASSREAWQSLTAYAEGSIGADDYEGSRVKTYDARGNGDGDTVSTITGDHENRITDYTSVVCYPDVAHTLAARSDGSPQPDKGNGANIVAHAIALDRAFYNQGQNAQFAPQYYEDGTVPTLVAKGPGAVAHSLDEKCGQTYVWENQANTLAARDYKQPQAVCCEGKNARYIVRRLTPTECARLQGFPDKWGHPDKKDELTDEEYAFWLEVRNTHAAINGKATKQYTREQMLTWYNKLHTDSAEYKMWGNGVALPCVQYIMEGIAEVMKE